MRVKPPWWLLREIVAIVAYAVFWTAVILGLVAAVTEWHYIRPMLGL